jgi:hypothetical protein
MTTTGFGGDGHRGGVRFQRRARPLAARITASVAGATAIVLAACGGHASGTPSAGGAVGATCTPSIEGLPTFSGFGVQEISVEENNPTCASGLCLVNHFQGLTTCPYGQDVQGHPPAGQAACTTPGTHETVKPAPTAAVPAWCTDRPPTTAVTCSCRCANAAGKTDDGATYCTCGNGFTCTQLVTPVSSGNPQLAGAYCVASGTAYDPAASCATTCDPTAHACSK